MGELLSSLHLFIEQFLADDQIREKAFRSKLFGYRLRCDQRGFECVTAVFGVVGNEAIQLFLNIFDHLAVYRRIVRGERRKGDFYQMIRCARRA